MPSHSCVFISIAGGEAAGKKTVLAGLKSKLLAIGPFTKLKITTLHMTDFMRELNEKEIAAVVDGKLDLVNIGAFDLDLMAETVERLMKDQTNVETPSLDFTGKKSQSSIVVEEEAPDVIIAEGCYLLTHKKLVDLATVKIFVDCDPDVRLARKVIRDQEERFLGLDFILDQYVRHSKPAFEQTILPTKNVSDIILPAGAEGPGVELIAYGVMDDIKGKRKRVSISHSTSHTLLPLALGEADLTTGVPSYYQAV